ncbi:MAG: hypothetical protein ACOVQ7_25805 [Limnoraphis robusta]|jgi:hypothetical protein
MTSTAIKNDSESTTSTPPDDSFNPVEQGDKHENSNEDLGNKKVKLTEEIKAYQAEKNKELIWSRRFNRWSIGIALALTAATAICGSSKEPEIQELVTPLGTVAFTLNGWIASVPMSKRVSLYELILVKADNLRSDLEFEAETEDDLEEIREGFKSLKVEFIQENPREQVKLHSTKSPSAS